MAWFFGGEIAHTSYACIKNALSAAKRITTLSNLFWIVMAYDCSSGMPRIFTVSLCFRMRGLSGRMRAGAYR
ncbi:hypothetical protein XI06_05480 [Bradyrhizobium sp. CCBAU 11434]|nr:hypothetical protein [Bradyrhizobium sp. CCBAU 11434]